MTAAAPAGAPVMPVSIVIAVWHGIAALQRCLDAFGAQRDGATEVLVVANCPLPIGLRHRHPWCEMVEAAPNLLIPHLWGIGIVRSRHPIVAITTAHFVPTPDYLRALRRAHTRDDAAGIGGAIDPRLDADAVTWATYFLRYSAYIGWRRGRPVEDFAGDNGSYKRAALPPAAEIERRGFWEQQIHRTMIANGQVLLFEPEIRMTQWASFGLWPFCVQRFRHGRAFGRERVAHATAGGRLMRLATVPLVPLLLLARVSARVVRSRANIVPFLRALPALTVFVLAWSLGEAAGYCSRSATPKARTRRQASPRA